MCVFYRRLIVVMTIKASEKAIHGSDSDPRFGFDSDLYFRFGALVSVRIFIFGWDPILDLNSYFDHIILYIIQIIFYLDV